MSESRSSSIRPVAGIDIGTNSIHLLIAQVDPALRSFSVLLTEKSTTRLGERDPDTGDLSPDAIERAFTTLRHCRELAASHGVQPGDIVTAATSAVREAPNGRSFLQALQDQLGLVVDLVSGPECVGCSASVTELLWRGREAWACLGLGLEGQLVLPSSHPA